MLTTDAVRFYGSKNAVAKAGEVTRQAVSNWGKFVPERVAHRLEEHSRGKLTVDLDLYRRVHERSFKKRATAKRKSH